MTTQCPAQTPKKPAPTNNQSPSTDIIPDSVQLSSDRLAVAGLDVEITLLARRLCSLGQARLNQELSALGLRVAHYWVLALVCTDTHLSQRELADFLDMRPSQIVSVINRLEKHGAVARTVDPQDRRSNVVSATSRGRHLYEAAAAIVEETEAVSLSRLTATERIDLRLLLQRLMLLHP